MQPDAAAILGPRRDRRCPMKGCGGRYSVFQGTEMRSSKCGCVGCRRASASGGTEDGSLRR